jgi:valyl-tRNA synthetase
MELPKTYNPKEAEKKWQLWWVKEGIYKFNPESKAEVYSIDTPPPTVSGSMHMGHAFSYSQQDFIARFQRMLGKNVFYPWGFDDNGLATERYVEKKAKVRAVDMPRREFIKVCLKETQEIEKTLKDSWMSLGISPDWDIFYRTIDEWVRKTSQRSFMELYKIGREYQKEAPTIYCPECRTAIAQVELEDKELTSYFNDVVFKVDGKDLIIATTRPELLSSCVAVFYHPDDKRYQKYRGKKATVPLFNYEVPIIPDERADPEKGTGIVMCCTFGDQTDIEWWKAHKLPLKMSIGPDGKMTELAGKYKGMSIATARKMIIEDLKDARLLLSQEPIKHPVNVHERCGTEIEFLLTKQWFIRYLDLKDKFIKAGKKIRWYPEHMRNRYDNWIKGLQWDWCISRQRYFGVPFPVWYCKKCGEVILANDKDLPVDPLEDKPPVEKCPKCSSTDFTGEKDVLDTWATSSLTPQIAIKWKEDEKFFKKMYPMSLRPQAHDIISFWAFNTVVKGLLHNKEIPWKNIMISGWALDPHGKKMSKSKGNVIDPLEMIKKYSSDSLRFWAASSKLGEDLWFSEKEFIASKKFFTKLWNASRFCFMHLKDYKPTKATLETMDMWLLSKLSRIVKNSTDSFMQYEYSRTKADVENFFWHTFCDNYLEMVKDRLYNPEQRGKDARLSAQYTLYNALLTILKLMAPITPHITEELYQSYYKSHEKEKSIHISSWPKPEIMDKGVEEIGDIAIDIISAIRRFKSSSNKSLKTPVKTLVIECNKDIEKKLSAVMDDIKGTTNTEKVEFGNGEIECREGLRIRVEM